ncbi:hypothetical protein Tco_0778435 [Tanacetum coccineum]
MKLLNSQNKLMEQMIKPLRDLGDKSYKKKERKEKSESRVEGAAKDRSWEDAPFCYDDDGRRIPIDDDSTYGGGYRLCRCQSPPDVENDSLEVVEDCCPEVGRDRFIKKEFKFLLHLPKDFPDCEDSQVSTRVSHPQLHFGNSVSKSNRTRRFYSFGALHKRLF